MTDQRRVIEAIRRRVESMDRDARLGVLKDSGGAGYWRGESLGYGSWAAVFYLDEDGLYGAGSESSHLVEGPYRLSAADIEAIRAGQEPPDCGELEEVVADLTKAGARPGIEYWIVASEVRGDSEPPELFTSRNEALSEADSLACWDHELLSEWDEMSDDELQKWVRVVLLMREGFTSVYELDMETG